MSRAAAELKLAVRQFRGSASRMALLVFCVALGVSAQVAIGSFVRQLNRHLSKEARSLLTADLEISKRTPLSELEKSQIKESLPSGAKIQEITSFVTMAASAQNAVTRLVELRAIPGDYPFYGKATILESGRATHSFKNLEAPEPIAYVQPELLAQINAHEGDFLKIGRAEFKIAGIIEQEPGLGSGIFSLGPRVYIGAQTVPRTQLIQSGSRATYSTLIACKSPDEADLIVDNLKKVWKLSKRQGRGMSERLGTSDGIAVRSPKDKQTQISRAFERMADYLRLISLVAILLGGIGVGSVIQSFVQDNIESAATLRTLGATENQVARVYLLQAALAGGLGSLIGALAGTLMQNIIPLFLADFVPMPARIGADPKSILIGMFFGISVSVYFSLLPALRVKGLKPLSIYRGENIQALPFSYRASILAGGITLLAASAMMESRSIRLGLLFSGSILGCGLFMILATRWFLPRLASIKISRFGFGFKYGLSNIARPHLNPQSAIVTLGMAALLLGFITVYQFSLSQEFRPDQNMGRMPNLFVIDVQDDQIDAVREFLGRENIADYTFSPMVHARYRWRNKEPAMALKTREQETNEHMRNREQNLSYRTHLSADETILRGRWMDPSAEDPEVSLEESFAKRIGARLGNVLTFDVQGVAIQAKVTSIRRVKWSSFKPNFFILMSPQALEEAPKTWVGSISGLSESRKEAVQSKLVGAFPNFTIFDVAEGGKKLLKILTSIYWSMRSIALFSIFSGLLVLAGLALATANQRKKDATLLKVLGAGRRTLFASTLTEFFFWGAISVAIGMTLALALGWGVLKWYLEMNFSVPWKDLAFLSGSMTALCAGIGLLMSRSVFYAKPMDILRKL